MHNTVCVQHWVNMAVHVQHANNQHNTGICHINYLCVKCAPLTNAGITIALLYNYCPYDDKHAFSQSTYAYGIYLRVWYHPINIPTLIPL